MTMATFGVPQWDGKMPYSFGDRVAHNSIVWRANTNISAPLLFTNDSPPTSADWTYESTLSALGEKPRRTEHAMDFLGAEPLYKRNVPMINRPAWQVALGAGLLGGLVYWWRKR